MWFRFLRRLVFALSLLLTVSGGAHALSLLYRVHPGDTLWTIARQYRMSVKQIRRLNGLRSNRLYPGQVLKLGPALPELPAPNGPYYWYRPKAAAQPSRDYRELSPDRPMVDYRHGQALLRAFDAEIQAGLAKRRSRKRPLAGWRIAIDPGHGGMDPGAIVANVDGVNRSVYVVEDEYVYDIALRVYRLLLQAGARVKLTVISPNHLIRENLQASDTFVNEQNEVYNDARYNRRNSDLVRPNGHNLSERVRIANRFVSGSRKSLFISLHADNSPERPKGPLVIYLDRRGHIDWRSKRFAEVMQKALDQPDLAAQIQGRSLWVLRRNHAHAEVLIETHNVHDTGEAWALRFDQNRQADAERIVKGILEYARRR